MSEIPTIRVVDVHKKFGSLEVLKGVSFEVRRGNVVSMLGASGSGKSTLLRCINHLEAPTSGDIFIAGDSMCYRGDAHGQLKPRPLSEINRMRRDLGFVFQQFNLWPHMTVLGNVIEAPRRVRGLTRKEADELGAAVPAPRAPGGQGRRLSRATFRRTAATRRDRTGARDAAEGDAVRRAHVFAGPRADRRSPRA